MKKLMLLGCALLLMIGLVLGVKLYAGHLVDSKLRQATQRIKQRADIDFKEVELELFGLNLTIHDVDVTLPTGQKARIGTVTVHEMDVKNKPPHYGVVDLHDVTMDVNKENFGKEYTAIKELGYDVLQANVHLDYIWEPDKDILELRHLRAEVPGVATVEAAVALRGFDVDRVRNMELEDLVIDKLHFSYDDHSLLRKVVQMTQVDEKEIIVFLVDGLREDIERARARQQQEAVTTMEEVITFIENPNGINIDVELGRSTSMQQIMLSKKITEIVKLFKIKVEATS